MRTRVTLDPDVATKLKAVARERGISFSQALNGALRAGLGRERRGTRAFSQYAQPMSPRRGFYLDKALQLAGTLEDEEILRRLERRK